MNRAYVVTFSRSGSSSARAKLLLSITEDAATSKGVEPLMVGHAGEKYRTNKVISIWPRETADFCIYIHQQMAVFTFLLFIQLLCNPISECILLKLKIKTTTLSLQHEDMLT